MLKNKKLKKNIVNSLKKVTIFTIAIVCVLQFSNCKSKSDVVASIDVENKTQPVIREQLKWLAILQLGPNSNKPTIEVQQQLLRSYLLSQIVLNENKNAKLEDTEEYKSNAAFLDEKASIAAFELFLREEDKDLEFDFIDTQWIILEKTKKADPKAKDEKNKTETVDRNQEADELVTKLNAIPTKDETKIEDFIFEKSENPRYKLQAGYLDPICVSCATNPLAEYSEKIESAPENKFFKIETPNAIWIIRVTNKYKIKSGGLQSKIEKHLRKVARIGRNYSVKLVKSDPAQQFVNDVVLPQDKIEQQAKQRAEWLIKKEKESFFYSHLYNIKKQNKLKIEDIAKIKPELEKSKVNPFKNETILYTLNEKTNFTYGDLLKKIEPYKTIYDTPYKQINLMHSLFIPVELLGKDEIFKKSRNSKLFSFVKGYINSRLITMAYFKSERSKIKVEPAEIKKQFEAEKVARFQNKPFNKNIEKSLNDEILQKRFGEWFNKQQETLAQKYKLSIKTNKLSLSGI